MPAIVLPASPLPPSGDFLRPLRQRAYAHLRPPPRLALSAWIEQTLRLPADVSAMPGQIRLYAYQRGIADSIGDPEIERVTLVKSVRVGFTTLLTGALASYVSNDPSPILVLLPTEADCRDYMVSDIEPIFAASPGLRGLLTEEADESGRNTLLSRRFSGGNLKIVASKAPRNLRRHNARILLIDECDAMERSDEGSVIRLAERRTLSFANRKIVLGSTPLLQETSYVLRAYEESDRRVYECPCPACGSFTEIAWANIEWPSGEPDKAAFRCPHCAALVEERHKVGMVEQGRWRATHPEVRNHAGFRLNALVSLLANASWARLAAEFLHAREDSDELQVFINTALGQGWREAADEVDDAELSARAEPFGLAAVPPEVLTMTAGVDVQDDRFEISFVGWTKEADALILAHTVLWGQTDDDSLWHELDEILKTRPPHPSGGLLRVDAAAIDASDGQHYDRVLSFCAPRMARRVVAIKGMSGTRPTIKASDSGKVRAGRLFIVGVDSCKGQILSRLARGRTIRFSDSLEAAYFEQLASERRVVRYTRGSPVRRFERIPGRRAEALDCLVYAFAVRHLAPIDPDRREAELALQPVARPQAVVRSAWLEQRGRSS